MKRHDPADVAARARFEKITRYYQLWAPKPTARAGPALQKTAASAPAAASWRRPAPAAKPGMSPRPDAARLAMPARAQLTTTASARRLAAGPAAWWLPAGGGAGVGNS